MRGLYAIIDVPALSARQLDPVRFADAMLSARPAAIQLRDKRLRAGVYELVAERARALHLALASGPLPSEDRS